MPNVNRIKSHRQSIAVAESIGCEPTSMLAAQFVCKTDQSTCTENVQGLCFHNRENLSHWTIP